MVTNVLGLHTLLQKKLNYFSNINIYLYIYFCHSKITIYETSRIITFCCRFLKKLADFAASYAHIRPWSFRERVLVHVCGVCVCMLIYYTYIYANTVLLFYMRCLLPTPKILVIKEGDLTFPSPLLSILSSTATL